MGRTVPSYRIATERIRKPSPAPANLSIILMFHIITPIFD